MEFMCESKEEAYWNRYLWLRVSYYIRWQQLGTELATSIHHLSKACSAMCMFVPIVSLVRRKINVCLHIFSFWRISKLGLLFKKHALDILTASLTFPAFFTFLQWLNPHHLRPTVWGIKFWNFDSSTLISHILGISYDI